MTTKKPLPFYKIFVAVSSLIFWVGVIVALFYYSDSWSRYGKPPTGKVNRFVLQCRDLKLKDLVSLQATCVGVFMTGYVSSEEKIDTSKSETFSDRDFTIFNLKLSHLDASKIPSLQERIEIQKTLASFCNTEHSQFISDDYKFDRRNRLNNSLSGILFCKGKDFGLALIQKGLAKSDGTRIEYNREYAFRKSKSSDALPTDLKP